MARLAGQKLRASYIAGETAGMWLLAADTPGGMAGQPVKASQIP